MGSSDAERCAEEKMAAQTEKQTRKRKLKPAKGVFCPWARDAMLASGRSPKPSDIACSAKCAMFGIFEGEIYTLTGCRRVK